MIENILVTRKSTNNKKCFTTKIKANTKDVKIINTDIVLS